MARSARAPEVPVSRRSADGRLRSSSRAGTIRDGATPPGGYLSPVPTNGASYPPLAQIHNRPRNRVNSSPSLRPGRSAALQRPLSGLSSREPGSPLRRAARHPARGPSDGLSASESVLPPRQRHQHGSVDAIAARPSRSPAASGPRSDTWFISHTARRAAMCGSVCAPASVDDVFRLDIEVRRESATKAGMPSVAWLRPAPTCRDDAPR